MSKRDPKRLPHDFHLWTAVASTVDPLRRKGLLKLGPLPLPVDEPAATVIKAPPARQTPRKPFLPPYQAPLPSASLPEKAVDPSIRRKLGRGRIEIDGTIDLHGMTQNEARGALHRYLHARVGRGDRTILVITGKGLKTDNDYIAAMSERGILRTMLPIWLSEPSLAPLVSGWSVAARGHGGEGAWYVRLRRL
ncbi:Smr/MutS family protein [Devosia lacusdianchii]|jgi:DNA-nicking Smr family endonuclease|uniref:Smr/MutS family protein n=1 Tax=Devosia lacusdianchii TaxID=2917991 RepID=UPI001F05A06C|nr:Smr/MutS family protein [Devosia sp. JXJ CY 41]